SYCHKTEYDAPDANEPHVRGRRIPVSGDKSPGEHLHTSDPSNFGIINSARPGPNGADCRETIVLTFPVTRHTRLRPTIKLCFSYRSCWPRVSWLPPKTPQPFTWQTRERLWRWETSGRPKANST